MKVIISGWYGHGNLGDEAILASLAGQLQARKHEVGVLSFDPAATEEMHGLEAYPQLPSGALRRAKNRIFGNLKETYRAIEDADVFVLGGGGFLSDWQPEAVRWWLSQLQTAEQMETPAMVCAIGAGPFFTLGGKNAARDYLSRNAVAVTVRDEYSKMALITACGVSASRISTTADPAVSMMPDLTFLPENPGRLREERATRPLTALVLTPHFDDPECWGAELAANKWPRLKKAYAQMLERLACSGATDVLLLCSQWKVDRPLAEELCAMLPERDAAQGSVGHVYIQPQAWTPAQTLAALTKCRAVLSVRLHGCILAGAAGVPCVGIIYHPKTDDFLRLTGQRERALEIGEGKIWPENDLDGAEAADRLLELLKNAETESAKLKPKMDILRKRESGNLRVIEKIGMLAERGHLPKIS